MNKLFFKEGYVKTEDWWRYKYQFQFIDYSKELQDEVYKWCIYNLNSIYGWHILFDGIVIFREEDAMAFKLQWT